MLTDMYVLLMVLDYFDFMFVSLLMKKFCANSVKTYLSRIKNIFVLI